MSEGLQRHRELNGGSPIGWQAVVPKAIPALPDPQAPLPTIYAVISTWQDEDIITATVRNCFNQGASKVFILDNASKDKSIQVALEAGATLGLCYETQMYDDDLRIQHQNEIIRRETYKANLLELWWMVLDADEFPSSYNGQPVSESLRGLPQEIRVIGTDCIDLYPTDDIEYVGGHPALTMTKGVWRRGNVRKPGSCHHWKHPILRLFNGTRDLAHNRGNHTVTMNCGSGASATIDQKRIINSSVFEPEFDLFMFHAPLRSRKAAEARLKLLCEGRSRWDDEVTKSQGAIRRYKALEDIYLQKWGCVSLPHTQVFGREVRGLALYPWRVLVPTLQELVGSGQ